MNFPQNGTQTVQNSDGTYTETETLITTETSSGWVTTYQTVVTRVYDSKGKLISTKKEGPTAISKRRQRAGIMKVRPTRIKLHLH